MPAKDPARQKQLQREWYLRKKAGEPPRQKRRIAPLTQEDKRRRYQEWKRRKRVEAGDPITPRYVSRLEGLLRAKEVADMIAAARASGCLLCPEKEPIVLDFHHIDPKTKLFGITRRHIKRNAYRLAAEIAKCVVLCKNCHAKVHAGILSLPANEAGRCNSVSLAEN